MSMISPAGSVHLHHTFAASGLHIDGLLVHATDEFMTVDKVLELAVDFDPGTWIVFDPPATPRRRYAWAPRMAEQVWANRGADPILPRAGFGGLVARLLALADAQDQPATGHVSLLHARDPDRLGPIARLVVLNETGIAGPEGTVAREGLAVLADGVRLGLAGESVRAFDGPLGSGVRLAHETAQAERRGLRRRDGGESALTYLWRHTPTCTAVQLRVHLDTPGAMVQYEQDSDALARALALR